MLKYHTKAPFFMTAIVTDKISNVAILKLSKPGLSAILVSRNWVRILLLIRIHTLVFGLVK